MRALNVLGLTTLLTLLLASAGASQLIEYRYETPQGDAAAVPGSSRYISPDSDVEIPLNTGVERRGSYRLRDAEGAILGQDTSPIVGPNDRFTDASGNEFLGPILVFPAPSSDGVTVTQSRPAIPRCPEGFELQPDHTCTRYERVDADEECPHGYYLDDGRCLRDLESPAYASCPTEWVLQGDECRQQETIPADYNCPSGYELDGSTCYLDVEQPAEASCDSGYELVDGECIWQDSQDAEVGCPSGYSWYQGQCVYNDTQPAEASCSDGFTYDGGVCIREEFEGATPTCPSGYVLVDGQCQFDESQPAYVSCPEGYGYDDGECVSQDLESAAAECPSGYDLEPTECFITEVQPQTLQCPSGYTLEGSLCEREESTPADVSCPSGYDYTNSDCLQTETRDATPTCPTGYTLSGSECVKTNYQDAEATCPSGWNLLDGQCREAQPADAVCPSGYNFTGDECRRIETEPASASCPSGFNLEGSECVRYQSAAISCPNYNGLSWVSKEHYETEPAQGTRMEGFNETRARWETDDYNRSGSQWQGPGCYLPRYQDLVFSAEIRLTDFVEPDLACPTGWNLQGGQCRQSRTPDYSCPSGWNESGSDCTRTLTEPNTYSCPSGFNLNGTTCERFQTPDYSCPSGWNLDGTTCEELLVEPADYLCPGGFSLEGTTCERTRDHAPLYSCEAGWERDGSTCHRTLIDSPEMGCAAGFHEEAGACRFTEYVAVSGSCPSGYTPSVQQCLREEEQAADASCPSGYTLDGSTCMKDESEPATASCPSGYSLESGECRKTETQSASASCPSGYTLQSGECRKTETQSATASCPSGYTLQSGECRRSETQSATASCPSGWTLQSGQCRQTEPRPIECPPHVVTVFGSTTTYPRYYHDSQPTAGTMLLPSMGQAWGEGPYVGRSHAGDMWTSAGCYTHSNVATNQDPEIVLYERVDPEYGSCPNGWTASGSNCIRTQSPTYSCPSGWSRSGTTCSRTLTESPTYSCPSGWSRSGTTCSRTLTESPTYSCPSGWSRSGTTCSRTLTESPTYSCSSGWTLSGTTCQRTLTEPATYSCPSGWDLDGNQCHRTLTEGPAYQCPSDWLLAGSTCWLYLAENPVYTCPEGWDLDGSQCERSVGDEPAYQCPAGWILVEDTCEIIEAEAPTYSCPTDWTLSGSSCHISLEEEPAYTCPSGWALDGNQCHVDITDTPNYSCNEDWNLSGDTCEQTVEQSVIYTCPSGWTRAGSECYRIHTEEPDYWCDDGWERNGTSCERTFVQSPSFACISGWDLRGKVCSNVSNHNAEPECPSGWDRSANQCLREAVKPDLFTLETYSLSATNSVVSQDVYHFSLDFEPPELLGEPEQIQTQRYWTGNWHPINANEGGPTLRAGIAYTGAAPAKAEVTITSQESGHEATVPLIITRHAVIGHLPLEHFPDLMSEYDMELTVTDEAGKSVTAAWTALASLDAPEFEVVGIYDPYAPESERPWSHIPNLSGFVAYEDGVQITGTQTRVLLRIAAEDHVANNSAGLGYAGPFADEVFTLDEASANLAEIDGYIYAATSTQPVADAGSAARTVQAAAIGGVGPAVRQETIQIGTASGRPAVVMPEIQELVFADGSRTGPSTVRKADQDGTFTGMAGVLPRTYADDVEIIFSSGDNVIVPAGETAWEVSGGSDPDIPDPWVVACYAEGPQRCGPRAHGEIRRLESIFEFASWDIRDTPETGVAEYQARIRSTDPSLPGEGFTSASLTLTNVPDGDSFTVPARGVHRMEYTYTFDFVIEEMPSGEYEVVFRTYQDGHGQTLQRTLETRTFDTEGPEITFLFDEDQGGLEPASLDAITVHLQDELDPDPRLISVHLAGGPDDIDIHLAWRAMGTEGVYALEYPPLMPSVSEGDYQLLARAADAAGNIGEGQSAEFTLTPPIIGTGESLSIPSSTHAFRKDDGTYPLGTGQIQLQDGSPIRAAYPVFASITADSEISVRIAGVDLNPGDERVELPAFTFDETGGQLQLPVSATEDGGVGQATVRLTTSAPNSPISQMKVNVWKPDIKVESDTLNVVQMVENFAASAAAGEASGCARLTGSDREARPGQPLSDPACYLEWTYLPDALSTDRYRQTNVHGVLVEPGSDQLIYRVYLFDVGGQIVQLERGEVEIEVESATDLMEFGFNPDPGSVYRGVMNVDLTLEQTAGPPCHLTTLESRAIADGERSAITCLVEWTELPEGIEEDHRTTRPRVHGRFADPDSAQAHFRVTISAFTPNGVKVELGEHDLSIDLEDPPPPTIDLDPFDPITDDLFAVSTDGGRIADVLITSFNTDIGLAIDVEGERFDSTEFGRSFRDPMNARRRVNAPERALWSVKEHTAHVEYRHLPKVSAEKTFNVVAVPPDGIRPEISLQETEILSNELATSTVRMTFEGSTEDFDPAAMGHWEVRLTNRASVRNIEPLTDYVPLDQAASADFAIDLEEYAGETIRLSAEARLIAPIEGYERTEVSRRPILITVLPAHPLETELTTRRVEGEAPLHVTISADIIDRQDRSAMGEVIWEVAEAGGSWETVDNNNRHQHRFTGRFEAGEYDVRATVVNEHSEAEFVTDTLRLHAFDVPNLALAGPWNVFVGDQGNYRVVDRATNEPVDGAGLGFLWSTDGGDTWEEGGPSKVLSSAEEERYSLMVRVRELEAPEDNPDAWQQLRSTVNFRPVVAPRARLYGDRQLEAGVQSTWVGDFREPYRDMEIEVEGEFEFPDGSIVQGDEANYVPSEDDLEQERVEVIYRARILGFEDQGAVGEAVRRVLVWGYEWPMWRISSRTSAMQAPADIDLRVRSLGTADRWLEDVQFSWDLPDGISNIEDRYDDGRSFTVTEAGTYTVEAVVTDGRGNESRVTETLVISEPDPWEVDMTWSASNPYNRIPVTLRVRPQISGGHPRDRISTHRYFLDGTLISEGSRYGYVTFDEAGEHEISLQIESTHGKEVAVSTQFTAIPNQPPTCDIEGQESSTGWRFYAHCSDPDGRIVEHEWTLDGEVISLTGSRISVRTEEGQVPTVSVVGIDDSGDRSEPAIW